MATWIQLLPRNSLKTSTSFVAVCGDGEYIVYTSLAWRNKAFGAGVGFAWATDSSAYAVREASSAVRAFRNFKERPGVLRISYPTDGIYGGTLLGVKGIGFVVFYDWETGAVVRRIDLQARNVNFLGLWLEWGAELTTGDGTGLLVGHREPRHDRG